eukprot:TRINITY_DN4688_c3_g1_i1.p1 TRINITY_DN4688_c3_g1~~TRINITY_DN4688_c3_g1_i1.p1  ORF type:complete len:223 (+),score=40.12 TRINITY_DN4688_c3_g1_i1:37-705(+)
MQTRSLASVVYSNGSFNVKTREVEVDTVVTAGEAVREAKRKGFAAVRNDTRIKAWWDRGGDPHELWSVVKEALNLGPSEYRSLITRHPSQGSAAYGTMAHRDLDEAAVHNLTEASKFENPTFLNIWLPKTCPPGPVNSLVFLPPVTTTDITPDTFPGLHPAADKTALLHSAEHVWCYLPGMDDSCFIVFDSHRTYHCSGSPGLGDEGFENSRRSIDLRFTVP